MRLESLSLDAWMPTTDGRTLISWISDLFTLSTPYATAVCPREDALSGLSRELMRHIASFLKPVELGALGTSLGHLRHDFPEGWVRRGLQK